MVVGIVAFALPVYLALDSGGYDLIVRQQLGLISWWLLALGLLLGILPRARPAPEARLAVLGLAGLVGWMAIGLIGTESAGRTYEELGRTLAYAGLVALAWASLGPRTWRDAAAGLSAAALAVPTIALASRLEPGAFEPVAAAELLQGRRLAYPLGYWNAVAAWCAVAFAIGLAWSAHSRRWEARTLALAALPIAGTAAYLTYSRAGIAALLIGVIAVVAAGPNRTTAAVHALLALAATAAVVLVVRSQPEIAQGAGAEGAWLVAAAVLAAAAACGLAGRWTRRARLERMRIPVPRGQAAAVGAVLGLIALAAALGPSVAGRAGDEFARAGQPEVHDDPAARLVTLEGARGEVWASALRAFRSSPATGIGAGSFQFWWERDVAHGDRLRDVHSLYLRALAELGLPGLLALLAFLAALLLATLRARRGAERSSVAGVISGLLAAYLVFAFHAGLDWLWEFPALVALGIGAAVIAGAARSSPSRPRSRLSRGRMAVVAIAIVAGAAEIPGVVSANRARASEAALALGLRERAADYADDAIRAAPWASDPYALRAFIALADGRHESARRDALAAIDRERTNWLHRLLLAHIEAEAGDVGAALEALEEAERLRPGLADHFSAARRALRAGDPLPR